MATFGAVSEDGAGSCVALDSTPDLRGATTTSSDSLGRGTGEAFECVLDFVSRVTPPMSEGFLGGVTSSAQDLDAGRSELARTKESSTAALRMPAIMALSARRFTFMGYV